MFLNNKIKPKWK